MLRSGLKTVTRNTEFLINTLLTLAAYFTLCAAVIAVTHSGYCRCGSCEDCRLRDGSDGEETTMTQATVSTIWPRVALFNYFAVPLPLRRFNPHLTISKRDGITLHHALPEQLSFDRIELRY